jgi:hypothetical protein
MNLGGQYALSFNRLVHAAVALPTAADGITVARKKPRQPQEARG